VSWDAVAAIGQVAGALAAAIAAVFSYLAVRTAKRVAEAAIEAELLKDYSNAEMYRSLRYLGDFGHVEAHKDKLTRIAACMNGDRSSSDPVIKADLKWAFDELHKDRELSAARRHIHHYFKRIWTLHKVKGISQDHLLALTQAQSGFTLWRDSAVPLTFALGRKKDAEGNPILETEHWSGELITAVRSQAPDVS
jgi:hypothetical protein